MSKKKKPKNNDGELPEFKVSAQGKELQEKFVEMTLPIYEDVKTNLPQQFPFIKDIIPIGLSNGCQVGLDFPMFEICIETLPGVSDEMKDKLFEVCMEYERKYSNMEFAVVISLLLNKKELKEERSRMIPNTVEENIATISIKNMVHLSFDAIMGVIHKTLRAKLPQLGDIQHSGLCDGAELDLEIPYFDVYVAEGTGLSQAEEKIFGEVCDELIAKLENDYYTISISLANNFTTDKSNKLN
jgi:hypothetical protein